MSTKSGKGILEDYCDVLDNTTSITKKTEKDTLDKITNLTTEIIDDLQSKAANKHINTQDVLQQIDVLSHKICDVRLDYPQTSKTEKLLDNLDAELERLEDTLEHLQDASVNTIKRDWTEAASARAFGDSSIILGNGNKITGSSIQYSSCDASNTGRKITVGGKEILIPDWLLMQGYSNLTIINNKVYYNGYEYRDGEWKKT